MQLESVRTDAQHIFDAALKAVNGRRCVAQALQHLSLQGPVFVASLGKAAASMAAGAEQVLGAQVEQGLVITRYGYGQNAPPRYRLLESAHPLPDQNSLLAGQALLNFCQAVPADATCLILISGGASALVEQPWPGISLTQLQQLNQFLLGSGLAIQHINECRRYLSRLKGGGLLHFLKPRRIIGLMLSDVQGDDPRVIGSGLLSYTSPARQAQSLSIVHQLLDTGRLPAEFGPLFECAEAGRRDIAEVPPPVSAELHILAGLNDAKQAAAVAAEILGYRVFLKTEFISGDAQICGMTLAETVSQGEPGVYLWGGEPTVVLPAQAGLGGRAQHLALSAAITLAGKSGTVLLAAGTDGSDGNSEAAGAIVDGETVSRAQRVLGSAAEPNDYLARADSGRFLNASGDSIKTGPTGSNVMDLMIGIRVNVAI